MDWLAVLLGAIGQICLIKIGEYYKWGFVALLLSSVCWVTHGMLHSEKGLIASAIMYICINTFGAIKGFFYDSNNLK